MSVVTDLPGIDQGELIEILARELQYPMVPMRHAAALLRQEVLDDATIRHVADVVERQVGGMSRLIGDLLDVSRMRAGALELRRVRTPFAELMDRAAESAGALSLERGHTLLLNVTAEPIYLSMDALRLEQALRCLIENATRFTDRNGHIQVDADREGTWVRIAISDTGIGIRTADLKSIFGLFAQSGQGGRVEPGLGVGLYLARHLVEAHGGTITAESAGAGLGSQFIMRLPCELPAASCGASAAVDPSPV